VTGTNFVEGGTTVTIGGVTVDADVGAGSPAAVARPQSAQSTLQFTVPDGVAVGQSVVTVTTAFGTVASAAAFTVDGAGSTTTTTIATTASTAAVPDTTLDPVASGSSGTFSGTGTALPVTGDHPEGVVLLGLGLLAGGTVTLVVRRRLRR
jgi:LPXTG-motif cell wall-anchored protein